MRAVDEIIINKLGPKQATSAWSQGCHCTIAKVTRIPEGPEDSYYRVHACILCLGIKLAGEEKTLILYVA